MKKGKTNKQTKLFIFLFSIDKIEDDEEDITDTEETVDYTNIEVTKLDIIDGLNSTQAKPTNLNEDPVLKREAEKKKEAEKKLRTSVILYKYNICHMIDIQFRFMTFRHHHRQENRQRKLSIEQHHRLPHHQNMKDGLISPHH